MSIRPGVDVDTATAARGTPGGHRVLVTNDDGIDSPGIRLLAQALAREHDVVVVAPRQDMSGVGTGVGRIHDRVPMERRDLGELEAYAIDGPPGLAVMSAALGAFGDLPDLVVSGINAGLNTGHSIIHSGTVGAALTAHTFGSRGLAVSLAPSDPWQWGTAVPVAVQAARWMLVRHPSHVLNVNVPAVPREQVAGVQWADLDRFGHFSVVTAAPGASGLDLEVRDRSSGLDPESDTARCLAGYVTLTAIDPVAQASVPDDDAARVVPDP
jgi:5'-nucleotidase